MSKHDPINHPKHYNSHPSGVEVFEITRHHCFSIGNALKYILRHQHKGEPVQDLKKAIWYLEKKIQEYEGESPILSRPKPEPNPPLNRG